jgi:hypothetical protein
MVPQPYCCTMRAFSAIILLTALVLPTIAFAEVQTFNATHTYILNNNDSNENEATEDHYE